MTDTTTYTTDELGNLLAVTLHAGTPTSDDVTLVYTQDGLGRRIARVKFDALSCSTGCVTDVFLYADALRIAGWIDENGDFAQFVYGTRANVPDYMIKDGEKVLIASDHLGSPRLALRASDGALMQRTDYDEFGRLDAANEFVEPGFVPLPFGFAGGLYDRDTGLVRFGAREYDAHVGRWTSKDPILFGGGDSNLFAYTLNDPVNRLDPSGLAFVDNVKSRFRVTNEFLFGTTGRAIRTGIGSLTAGAVSRTFGTTTPIQGIRTILRGSALGLPLARTGIANLGLGGTVGSIVAQTVLNSVLVLGTLEAGIAVGSVIGAGFDFVYEVETARQEDIRSRNQIDPDDCEPAANESVAP